MYYILWFLGVAVLGVWCGRMKKTPIEYLFLGTYLNLFFIIGYTFING